MTQRVRSYRGLVSYMPEVQALTRTCFRSGFKKYIKKRKKENTTTTEKNHLQRISIRRGLEERTEL
jgi:hypothetical protein